MTAIGSRKSDSAANAGPVVNELAHGIWQMLRSRTQFTQRSARTFVAAALLSAVGGEVPAEPKLMPTETKQDPSVTPLDFLFGTRYQTDYNSRGISQSNRSGSFQVYTELQ